MKGILIDPAAKTVTEVEVSQDYRDIYKHIGASTFDCRMLTPDLALYVDDEGLLKDEPGPFFTLHTYPHTIAGKGLLLGVTPEGNSKDCPVQLASVKAFVDFPDVTFVGFEDSEGEINHPLFGKMVQISRVAKFKAK